MKKKERWKSMIAILLSCSMILPSMTAAAAPAPQTEMVTEVQQSDSEMVAEVQQSDSETVTEAQQSDSETVTEAQQSDSAANDEIEEDLTAESEIIRQGRKPKWKFPGLLKKSKLPESR